MAASATRATPRAVVLFDFDGTLADSAPGILDCVRRTIAALHLRVQDLGDPMRFIGPPLGDSFARYLGLSGAELKRATALYRGFYAERGVAQSVLYPGIAELLRELREDGSTLAVATSKYQEFAIRSLERLGIARFFSVVGGTTSENLAESKASVVARVLAALGASRDSAVMVGDRRFDVAGAHANGLPAVGVLYGYGSREELRQAGADALADSVAAIAAPVRRLVA